MIERLPSQVQVRRLLGGLAADTDEPMGEDMMAYVQSNWRTIEEKFPSIRFNHDFWSRCQPRRATWPACRGVIAAREQGQQYDEMMTGAIQRAYYQQARNPSDDSTLIALADELGLDSQLFSRALNASSTQERLLTEIHTTRKLNAHGFPGLVLQTNNRSYQIAVDYQSADAMQECISGLLAAGKES
ncbi:DsbA family protein [Thiolapillus sp.]